MPHKSPRRARIQGNLDGLCGVYAVVNSVRNLIRPRLNSDEERELFRCLISKLGEEGRLEDTICQGMTVQPLGRLIDTAGEFVQIKRSRRLGRQLSFRQAPESLQHFWEVTSKYLGKHGAGSVILGLGGKYDHWTCIDAMSESLITLIDSDGIRRLNRKNCTISNAKGSRHHVLWPTQTYFLSVDS